MKTKSLPFFLAALQATTALTFATGSKSDYERALSLSRRTENKVFRSSINPQWLPDGKRFWYKVATGPSVSEHVIVEMETGKVTRAANIEGLGLPAEPFTTSNNADLEIRPSKNSGDSTNLRMVNRMNEAVDLFWVDTEGKRQPYGRVKPGEEREQNTYAGHVWLLTDSMGSTVAVFEARADRLEVVIDGKGKTQAREGRRRNGRPENGERREREREEGEWTVRFDDNNVQLRNRRSGETETLTKDGTASEPYRGPVSWSPDGQSFVVTRVKEASQRKVTIVETSPGNQVQPKLREFSYQKPGDELPRPRPVLFRLNDRKPITVGDELFPNAFEPDGRLEVRWSPRSDEFYFDYNQRGHQVYRIIGVNAASGEARAVVEEKSDIFIDYREKTWRHWLPQSTELLWMSERDGWCHLYRYDVSRGAVKNQITRGNWVVRDIAKVDEEKQQIWFMAGGLRPDEDPYHPHLCRVNFDGSGFIQLTDGNGSHSVKFAPDGKTFIDTWSRADQPPVIELRRSEDGKKLCELERADAQALLSVGWTMPERFVAKGRDGKTDIHGVIVKPSNFDPNKKYPILEEVYAGPHGSFAPKTFGRLQRHHALAELGFIVVQVDGMGTNYRGKEFHRVAFKNLGDAGFRDRIAWIRKAGESRPWMDLSRVGIYGGSAGGQSAMRALIDHHDFYKAAFADCGCHDNRMDKIWWNEQWLSWPLDDSYVRASNVVDAHKMKGQLMLCVGELDNNVDPASTMQVVNALEKADKDFELLFMTNTGHGAAETPYGSRRRMDFFVRHLHGVVPRHE